VQAMGVLRGLELESLVLEVEADNSIEIFARSGWQMGVWRANVAVVGRVVGESVIGGGRREEGGAANAAATAVRREEVRSSGCCRLRVPRRRI